MQHRTVHRGIVALAIVTSLSVAGARPAAAANLGLLDRLAGLWSFVTGIPGPAPHRTASSRSTAPRKATTSPPAGIDKGWGIDPNGNEIVIAPETAPSGS